LTREGQPRSNKAHGGWKSDSASERCKHADGQDDDSENAFNQRDIDKRSVILHLDIKDFYLNMPMEQPEYMRMKLSNLPQEFANLYNLTKIAEDNGNV
jgi:hypothetical protein